MSNRETRNKGSEATASAAPSPQKKHCISKWFPDAVPSHLFSPRFLIAARIGEVPRDSPNFHHISLLSLVVFVKHTQVNAGEYSEKWSGTMSGITGWYLAQLFVRAS